MRARTTLNVDPALVEEVMTLTGEKDKGRAVNKAMEEFVRRGKIEKLLALAGKIEFDGDWDERHERDFELEKEHHREWH